MLIRESDTTILLKGKARVVRGEAEVFGCRVNEIETEALLPLYVVDAEVEVEG